MNLTLDELLKGKGCSIKGKEFKSAAAYVEPFLERMSKLTNDFIVQAKLPDCISLDEQNGEDKWYSRVYIQAVLPEEISYPNHKEAIGMIYALDTRKPVVKLFRNGLNMACLNLCVFNSTFLHVSELEPEKAINYRPIKELIEQTSDIAVWLKRLEETEVAYNEQTINENLGLWIRNSINASYDNGYGKVKIAASDIINGYKNLYEKKDSPYYVKPGETTSLFNVYNSFTDIITNDGKSEQKDIVNKTEKTLLLKEILVL